MLYIANNLSLAPPPPPPPPPTFFPPSYAFEETQICHDGVATNINRKVIACVTFLRQRVHNWLYT